MPRTRLFSKIIQAFAQTPYSSSRRRFLKLALTGAVLSKSIFQATPAFSSGKSSSPVVIVGAGIAGLTAAYRLMQAGIPCALYEASARLGGRIWTRPNFNPEGMFCELGGELIDTGHTHLQALCHELGVPLERFPEETPGALFYFNERLYNEADAQKAFVPLAEVLLNDLKKCFPDGQIRTPTYQDPANAAWLDQLSLQAYLDQIPQLAPWFKTLLKVAYTGEYGLDPHEQSALNLVLLLQPQADFALYGKSDETMRIQGGNSQLIHRLQQAIQGQVPVYTHHVLTELFDAGTHLQLIFQHHNQSHQINTQQALLTLPFTQLRKMNGLMNLAISPVKKRCIQELGYGTNSKLCLGFKTRFWQHSHAKLSAHSGELYSDLPSQAFWDSSRLQAGDSGILTNFQGGKSGLNATTASYQPALRDLKILAGKAVQPDHYQAFFNWSRYPWTQGSYTCPKPGQYTQLMGAAGEPELNGRLFFAGEHCSLDWMGYMNGAVESAQQAADQIQTLSTAQFLPTADELALVR